VLDRGDQLRNVVIDPAADLLLGQDREPDLDHIHPRRAGRSEVKMHARVTLQPAVDLRVARYDKEHKQATRQRIVEAAGRRFKQDGIDGAGVTTLMSDAGLTNGAFYAHFDSKEDLVANVLADQLRAQRQGFEEQPSDRAGLEAFIRSYLSPEHRDQYADGCPSAALLDEIGRRPAATGQVFTDELMGVIDDIASRLDPTDAEAARTDALTIFGLMVGTLQLARALTDPDLSDQLLARGVETALKLLDDMAR
jgi:TetR/AcrR family transcriptional repressor of nem operon